MKILWFTWKDKKNPFSGGAEIVNEELAKRLVQDGNEVILIVAGFKGALSEEIIDGYKIIRLGDCWTVYWQAYKYYKKHFIGWADSVIDEVNAVPFFCKFYVKERNIILSYQLCREIWFYQMFFPLNLIGYLIEPIYLWLLRKNYVLTESESTKKDFQKYGFKNDKISVFPIGLEIGPISEEEFNNQKKEENFTILYLGTIRNMKRPDQIIKAFELAKKDIKNLKLWIVGGGGGKYFGKIMLLIDTCKYKNDITYFGKVDNYKKLEIIKKCHLLCVTSVKEGWGIVVTEANSQGTPAVAYNVDGLRDSVKNNVTGIVCQQNTPENLATNIVNLLDNNNKERYNKLRKEAWEWSKQFNYNNSYEQFIKIINKI